MSAGESRVMASETEVADLYAWSRRERDRAGVLQVVSRAACAAARDMVSRCAERRIRHEHGSAREA